jgi:hypothetical protein
LGLDESGACCRFTEIIVKHDRKVMSMSPLSSN